MADLKVGVVTGGHAFDLIGFHTLFRDLDGMECYIQPLEDWAWNYGQYGHQYDVVVFFNMHTAAFAECPGGKRTAEAIGHLGEGQGIVVLHHGILAFKPEPMWDEIVGMTNRTIDSYSHDENLHIRVEEGEHEITEGVLDWEIIDETYEMHDVDEGSHVLLTVDHPKSMKVVGWTRSYRESRVFCYQLGHDRQAWTNATFRQVLRRGIVWAAG